MKALKILLTILICAVAISAVSIWYRTFIVGEFYVNAAIHVTVLMALVPVLTVVASYFLIKLIFKNK